MILTRYGSIPGQGTFGELTHNGFSCKTIEREWLDNKPFVSCIPAGEYKLIPHTRPNGDEVYAIVNESTGIYQYPNPKAKRDLILIHKANIMTELAGCIAPGNKHGSVHRSFGVHGSGNAMDRLREALGSETHTLKIQWRCL
jgi:hypothetical protein